VQLCCSESQKENQPTRLREQGKGATGEKSECSLDRGAPPRLVGNDQLADALNGWPPERERMYGPLAQVTAFSEEQKTYGFNHYLKSGLSGAICCGGKCFSQRCG